MHLPEGKMASPIKTACHNGGQRKRLDAKPHLSANLLKKKSEVWILIERPLHPVMFPEVRHVFTSKPVHLKSAAAWFTPKTEKAFSGPDLEGILG